MIARREGGGGGSNTSPPQLSSPSPTIGYRLRQPRKRTPPLLSNGLFYRFMAAPPVKQHGRSKQTKQQMRRASSASSPGSAVPTGVWLGRSIPPAQHTPHPGPSPSAEQSRVEIYLLPAPIICPTATFSAAASPCGSHPNVRHELSSPKVVSRHGGREEKGGGGPAALGFPPEHRWTRVWHRDAPGGLMEESGPDPATDKYSHPIMPLQSKERAGSGQWRGDAE